MTAAAAHLLGLEVLDRQLIDSEGELCGKVDDLELDSRGGRTRVTAIVFGPAAWPDRLPRLLTPLARRLFHGKVTRIEWDQVAELSSAVRLKLRTSELEGRRTDLLVAHGATIRLSLLLGRRLEGTGGRSRGRVYDLEVMEGESGPEATALLVGWPGLLARLGLKRSVADRARISWDQAAHLPRSGSW
jgi:sporulation protein YlmC with PRC-barrel domain